ncbi:MAG: SDR family NAD(P)-dependent oxidoreductase [Hyphomicrobiaceae bacterium]|nr:SDR family NAD(P)-dependent oxidoreductase [Hyphomicrobiaceae bacterium]
MSQSNPSQPVCVVVGVGPGNGAAFVRRFAEEGYRVAMIARSSGVMDALAAELPVARPYICDIGDAVSVESTFARITSDMGPVDALVYNAGKGVWGAADEVSLEDFETAWRTNVLGAFVAARCVIPDMRQRGSGQILLIGATASLRGGAKTAAFASAKAAQRSLAQSLARQLWPSGIHVALVIVDGIVDEPLMRSKLADRPDEFFVKPEDIADTLMQLVWQRRSAWSFEVEARPFGETW